ncbi:DNA-3-methyladenine glycosylase family protein [Caldibacillus debilis]|uniref:DNA-3-methyladenine glycosylase family protein n=1 Tax=Caldibacillus debilis TaxID=301148 RepID=UPI000B56B167|nr:DNA-3-methyladenine glycosylase [Caldibacillus debilis]OUM89270.1 MAG: DNA-3-methyladenine glycosylase [Caldibacillus debilis]
MWSIEKKIEGPYDFDQVLARNALDPLRAVNRSERSILVPLWIRKRPVVIKVRGTGDVHSPSVRIEGEEVKYRDEAVKEIERIFQFNEPLQPIHDHFRKTSLAPIFEKHRGTPLVLDFDYFESITRCIIHQQLNLKFAYVLTERFVRTFGTVKDGVPFYPLPEDVARLSPEQLRPLQFSQRKAEYVIGFAEKVASGELDLQELVKKEDEEIIRELIRYRGIGRWTAENFLLFGAGRKNLFPKADIGLQRAVQKVFGLKERPTEQEMEEIGKEWEPYLSYASLYLWRSIEPGA